MGAPKLGSPSLSELKSAWTFDDLMKAHAMLDAYEDAEDAARTQAEREAEARRLGARHT